MFNFSTLINILISVAITLVALSGHEFAHGWVSSKLGDPTPRNQGRLTLNPLAHLDPIGTIMMILFHFGWAKPVQVNPMYYKDRKKGMALTALAGPAANLIMAFFAMVIYMLIIVLAYNKGWSMEYGTGLYYVGYALQLFASSNICLMVFNLIPIPPLDGAKIFGVLLPDNYYYKMLRYEKYVMILLMVLCITGVFSRFISVCSSYVLSGMIRLILRVFGIFM